MARYTCRKTNTAFQNTNITLTIQHCGGIMMVWGCFVVLGHSWFAAIYGSMKAALYLKILTS